jgi:protein TonB
LKRPVSLHEFMPYGAPDLLGAERAHMSRALLVSSTFAAAAFLLLGALVQLFPPQPLAVKVPPILDVIPIPEARTIDRVPPHAESRVPPAIRRVEDIAGRIAPVREDRVVLPEWWNDIGRITDQVQPGTGPSPIPPDAGTSRGTIDPDAPATYVEVLPVAVTEVKPPYPDIAIQAHVEGKVIVLVLVGRDGRVREAKVDENRHVLLLDAAALEAARRWVFSPALVNGHPVATWTAIPFDFKLY